MSKNFGHAVKAPSADGKFYKINKLVVVICDNKAAPHGVHGKFHDAIESGFIQDIGDQPFDAACFRNYTSFLALGGSYSQVSGPKPTQSATLAR